MSENVLGIPIVECEEAGDDIYLLPMPQRVTVYLAPDQTEATEEQKMAAILEAFTQAAKRGEVSVIRNVKP